MAAAREAMTTAAIAIPAYDAAYSVGRSSGVHEMSCPDVLVIDDGSRDGIADAARNAGAEVHSFSSNRGKGAALNAAFKILFSRGFTAVVTVDADGQHLPEEIPGSCGGGRPGPGHARPPVRADGRRAQIQQPPLVERDLVGRGSSLVRRANRLPALHTRTDRANWLP